MTANKRALSYGYLRPRADRVDDLTVEFLSGTTSATVRAAGSGDAVLENWPPGSDITATVTCTVDLDGVLGDCGFDPSGDRPPIVLFARWSCPSTSIRGSGRPQAVRDGVNRVSVDIDGSAVSRAVNVELVVTLGSAPNPRGNPVSPSRPGSVLWRDSVRVYIEGSGTSVPTTPLDFREAGIRPDGAMWRIEFDRDLEVHASRGVRVLINSSHPVCRKALDNLASGKRPTPETRLWQRFLEIDLRTQLAVFAVGHAAETDLTMFADDEMSFGASLLRVLQLYFPNEDWSRLHRRSLDDPGLIPSAVQNLFREAV